MDNNSSPHHILHTFLHVQDGGKADLLPITPTFWQELAGGAYPQLEEGRLMSAHTFAEPWPVWERHPAGDEVGMLLSGAAELVLDLPDGEQTLSLSSPGDYAMVPSGV
ncbi:hypothetical protein ACUHMQ_12350 [Chitinimonas sp. PSY-7]|uniref:hypothetical protein n=1 Tax=Chitinimonas sp. PSY-7 TaxID=3459088 RepID=UPI00403FD24B